MSKYYYKTADHRGGLKECLETEKPISNEDAEILIKYRIYQYYGYDERIKAHRFIRNKHWMHPEEPVWIHKYKKKQNKIDNLASEYVEIFFKEIPDRVNTELIIFLSIALIYATGKLFVNLIINKVRK